MKYPKAPIREAIFDIKIKQLENKSYKDFSIFKEIISPSYENERKLNIFEKTFKLESDKMSDSNSIFRGVICSNKNNNRQAQFRIDGFTLNYLAPYSDWEEFKNEAFDLWRIFSSVFENIQVERIALRYINRIEIPLNFNGFEEYLNYVPQIPEVLPKKVISFFSQIIVPCNDANYTSIITNTIETQTDEVIPYILDIDVYKEIFDSNWDFKDFEYLREIKNSIFESSITDKTRLLFI